MINIGSYNALKDKYEVTLRNPFGNLRIEVGSTAELI